VTNTSCGAYTCGTGGDLPHDLHGRTPIACRRTSASGPPAARDWSRITSSTRRAARRRPTRPGNGRNGTLAVAGTGTATFSTTHMVGTGSVNLRGTSNSQRRVRHHPRQPERDGRDDHRSPSRAGSTSRPIGPGAASSTSTTPARPATCS
jgi:hypothetical protein